MAISSSFSTMSGGLAGELVQVHGPLQTTQIGFDVPTEFVTTPEMRAGFKFKRGEEIEDLLRAGRVLCKRLPSLSPTGARPGPDTFLRLKGAGLPHNFAAAGPDGVCAPPALCRH